MIPACVYNKCQMVIGGGKSAVSHLSRKALLGESPRPHSSQGDLGPQSGWGWTQVTQHFLLYSEKFVLEFFRETQQEIQR